MCSCIVLEKELYGCNIEFKKDSPSDDTGGKRKRRIYTWHKLPHVCAIVSSPDSFLFLFAPFSASLVSVSPNDEYAQKQPAERFYRGVLAEKEKRKTRAAPSSFCFSLPAVIFLFLSLQLFFSRRWSTVSPSVRDNWTIYTVRSLSNVCTCSIQIYVRRAAYIICIIIAAFSAIITI